MGVVGARLTESDGGSSAPGDGVELAVGRVAEGRQWYRYRLGWLPVGTVVAWSDTHVHVRLHRECCGVV